MRRRRASRLLALGVATMFAANIWTPAASAQDASAQAITWGECPQDIIDLGYTHVTCANLQVPLDYTRPDGRPCQGHYASPREPRPGRRYRHPAMVGSERPN